MAMDEDTRELPLVTSAATVSRPEPSTGQALATVSVALIISLAFLLLLWSFL